MSEIFKHARVVSPLFIDNKNGTRDDFHGITEIASDVSQSTTDEFIVGQADKCATLREIPEATVPVTMNERGEIESYLKMANLTAEPVGGLRLTHFSSGVVDVLQYFREEESGAVEATVWNPKTSIDSLSISIDADSKIVRNFNLIGTNRVVAIGDNRYIIHKSATAGSGVSGAYVIDVSDPAPVEHPHISGKYILRVDRTRDGVLETIDDDDYIFDSLNNEVEFDDAAEDDIYSVYYSASSWGSGGDLTTVDADDECFLKAENVTVLIHDGTTEVELDAITSISPDASLTRLNEATVGTTDKINEISETPVSLSISGRVKKDFKVEKAFMNVLGGTNMISDVNTFKENVTVTIKIYNDVLKTTFLIGYQIPNLAFNDSSLAVSANEFVTLDFSGSTTDILITKVESNLAL